MLNKIIIIAVITLLTTSCSLIPKKFDQKSFSDAATIKFKPIGKSWIEKIEVCQKDNSGSLIAKRKGIKVKANVPTQIWMKVNDRDSSCYLNIETSFSSGEEYFLSPGFIYESRSTLKILLNSKKKGVCKVFLTDQEVDNIYSQQNGFPLSKGRCSDFTSDVVDKSKIFSADSWIKLNKIKKKQ